MKREAYLDAKNTKHEVRNLPAYDILGQAKQYQNVNDPNSKLCLVSQIEVYGLVPQQISPGSRLFSAGRFVPFDCAQDRRYSAISGAAHRERGKLLASHVYLMLNMEVF